MRACVFDALKACALALQRGELSLVDLRMRNVLDLAAEEIHPADRRIIKYFAEALARRACGLHPLNFKGSNWEEVRRDKFSIFWIANNSIKDVIRGKSKVHIIDLSFFYFFDISLQWTKLMDRLGDQSPRSLRLSVIVRGNINTFYKEQEEELTRKARAKGIVFEVKRILVDSLVDIDKSLVEIENDEFVVVNSLFEFSKMLSNAGDLQEVLQRVRDVIKPNFMVIAEHDADHNQSDFVLRLIESLKYYSALLNISWSSLDVDDEQHYRYEICNIVACEGSERVERHQTLVQWISLLKNSGFFPVPVLLSDDDIPSDDEIIQISLENGFIVIKEAKENQGLFFISAWEVGPFFQASAFDEGLPFISGKDGTPTSQTFEEASYHTMEVSQHMWKKKAKQHTERLATSSSDAISPQPVVMSKVRGKKPYVRVRGLSLGPTPTEVFGAHAFTSTSAQNQEVTELKSQVIELRQQVASLNALVMQLTANTNLETNQFHNLIRMASLAEIYDISQKITRKYGVPFTLTWANRTHAAVFDDEWSSPHKPILLLEEAASIFFWSDCEEVMKYHLEGGKGYVGKSLELNRPSYIPELRTGAGCVCVSKAIKEVTLGGLAIKLSSRNSKYGDYVVEFLFQREWTLEKQRWSVDSIISDLRNTNLSFVTYGKQGPVLQFHETAVSNIRPMRGNLLSQLTSDWRRDENVLHWRRPHKQLHGNATSNTKALIDNPVVPSTGDAMDVQAPYRKGIKRQRPLRSEVWDHYVKEEMADGSKWATCKYCNLKKDGSSKKGTSHLKKHLDRHHGGIIKEHQSSNRSGKDLENQSFLKEKSVLDQDKIHLSVLDQGKIYLNVAKMINKNKVPLRISKDEHFDHLFRWMQPFKLQSEKDFGFDHILHLYDEEKNKIRRYFDKLSCRFNLTINLWQDDAYKRRVNCCFTVQFIDNNWELKKKILSFERLDHDSGTRSLSKIFEVVLSDWDINDKTCSLTIHNSFSNDEIVPDESWPPGIYYLSYDKCIRDISLKSVYQVCKEMTHQQNRGYTLMSVESSNNWRICSLILAIVAILHPYMKFNYVESVYKEIYGDDGAKEHLKKITNFLVGLYDEYTYNCSNPSEFTTASGDSSYSSMSNAIDKFSDSFRKRQASNRRELDQYLVEEVSSTNFDILNWWHKNRSRFPILEKMARDFLAIPWSTIVSSFAFVKEISKIISNSGVQDPKIIRAILCCQKWSELANGSARDEKFMMEPRAWSKKTVEDAMDMQGPHQQDAREYLLWDFTRDEFMLLEKWKNPTKTGKIVGMDKNLKVTDKNLAPLVLPLGGIDTFDYYIDDEVINAFFYLLGKRHKEFPNVYLKHHSFDALLGTTLVDIGGRPPSYKLEDQTDICKLFLPLCFFNHWTLFYVDIKDQKFVWLNSLIAAPQVPGIERIIEWFKRTLLPSMGLNNALNWPFEVPTDIPQQTNLFDCGIFVMKYADCLTHANCIGFPFSQADMPYFRKRIFLDIYNGRISVPEKFVRS